jgi:hypothetical protein
MNMPLSKGLTITSWILQLIAAVILFQTLFFKFSGAKESIYIFSTVGMEPWGRIGSGIVELIASIMLVIPATVTVGALISLVTIRGAIFFHLTSLESHFRPSTTGESCSLWPWWFLSPA